MGSQTASGFTVPLESVICTRELNRRQPREPDFEAVTGALVTLARTMADSPERTLQQLVETALTLCRAQSAGISLLEEENGSKIFRWHGVAGEYAPHLWGTTPRDFSPCGTVLDTNQVQLMSHLDRHFRYFADVAPPIAEALLVPFQVGGEPVGTIWVIAHDNSRQFDREDARVLTTLGEFAAASGRKRHRERARRPISRYPSSKSSGANGLGEPTRVTVFAVSPSRRDRGLPTKTNRVLERWKQAPSSPTHRYGHAYSPGRSPNRRHGRRKC